MLLTRKKRSPTTAMSSKSPRQAAVPALLAQIKAAAAASEGEPLRYSARVGVELVNRGVLIPMGEHSAVWGHGEPGDLPELGGQRNPRARW